MGALPAPYRGRVEWRSGTARLTDASAWPIFSTVSDPTPSLFPADCPHPYTTSPTGIPREGDPAICSACKTVRGTFGIYSTGELFIRPLSHVTVTTGGPAPRVGAWVAFLVTSEGRRLVPISEVPVIQRGDAFSTLGPPEGGVIGWKVYGGINPTAGSSHYEVRWVDAEAPVASAV